MALFSFLLVGGSSAFADSNPETVDQDVIEVNDMVLETNENLDITNGDSLNTRAGNTINIIEWLHVGGKAQNGRWVPVSNKIWQVRYVGGKKYQGYLYWTGAVKVNVSDPRPNFNQYQFQGFLSRA